MFKFTKTSFYSTVTLDYRVVWLNETTYDLSMVTCLDKYTIIIRKVIYTNQTTLYI